MAMDKKIILIFVFSLLLIVPLAAGKQQMVLLAISETANQTRGGTADLIIDTRPGTGRVFIDSFPLTKLDTQISVRFAKEIACSYLDMRCNNIDFFYTIRSDSVIIGGPSAGAALTMLTLAELKRWDIDDETTITGTINPGGFIGNVGGVAEKLVAADKAGLKKVLIPKASVDSLGNESFGNLTEDPKETYQEIADRLGLKLVEVTTLDEVIYEFTGKRFEKENIEIEANDDYIMTMEQIEKDLCGRAEDLMDDIINKSSDEYVSAFNQTQRAAEASGQGAFYSAASFCFGANIQLSNLLLRQEELSKSDIRKKALEQEDALRIFDLELEEKKLKTLTDLQTYMIVKERLIETESRLKEVFDNLERNSTEAAVYSLAYARERFESAIYWSRFFENPGKKFDISESAIKNSCIEKLSEAEERYQYATLYIPAGLSQTRIDLNKAYVDKEEGRYRLCLFKASKAKAESNLLLGALGISEETTDEYLDIKLRLVEETINSQQNKDIFPILGYSYYEYSKSLAESDPYSAMLYAEYALELSNQEIYFSEPSLGTGDLGLYIDWSSFYNFLVGAAVGVILTLIFFRRKGNDECVSIRIKKR